MFDKVLIANRGEIAVRIHRACQELGIKTVSVHSTADADAMHARLSNESVCIGPAAVRESYLNIPSIIAAAEITNADAIHPGYGFLSENANFASIVEEHGFTFIGPTSEHISMMGDKVKAKETMQRLGVPVVPGSSGALVDVADFHAVTEEIGYPVLVKAVSGGGGRGMKRVYAPKEMAESVAMARAEAISAFGDGSLYLEKLIDAPRHVEVQVLADQYGAVVHLGERDCSLQRRHQKMLEEAPSSALNAAEREKIGAVVVDAVAEIGYRGVGTVEFLYEDGEFFFIEMNTRLQVEHPVTEMVTGVDLVREQLRIASGAPLSIQQEDVVINGHSIECRINAENPKTFVPNPGKISSFHAPGGFGVRVDSGLYDGYTIPPYYDSLVAKLIVHGANRNECLMRLRRTLLEFVVDGVDTTIPLHLEIIENKDIVDGNYDIHWLEKYIAAKG